MTTRPVCAWCNRILEYAPQPDPSLLSEVYCSLNCMTRDQQFRFYNSDAASGLRYSEAKGINPNYRGKPHEKGRKGSPKTPPDET